MPSLAFVTIPGAEHIEGGLAQSRLRQSDHKMLCNMKYPQEFWSKFQLEVHHSGRNARIPAIQLHFARLDLIPRDIATNACSELPGSREGFWDHGGPSTHNPALHAGISSMCMECAFGKFNAELSRMHSHASERSDACLIQNLTMEVNGEGNTIDGEACMSGRCQD